MNDSKHISSLQNPLVKKVLLLKEKSRERNKSGVFILEGQRELKMALKGGYEFDTLFFSTDILSENTVFNLVDGLEFQRELISVSKEVYQKMAHRGTTEGVLAITNSKSHSLSELVLTSKNPLILVAEAPEKPGNIGALLRTADAANVDAVIISNPRGDLYNPNIIRSSVGCLFTNNIATGSTSEIIDFLKKKKISIYCASLSASENYIKVNFIKSAAIVVGTESTGLTQEWLTNSSQNIIIPMRGKIDSMNVSVSAAILLFEAIRQRGLGEN